MGPAPAVCAELRPTHALELVVLGMTTDCWGWGVTAGRGGASSPPWRWWGLCPGCQHSMQMCPVVMPSSIRSPSLSWKEDCLVGDSDVQARRFSLDVRATSVSIAVPERSQHWNEARRGSISASVKNASFILFRTAAGAQWVLGICTVIQWFSWLPGAWYKTRMQIAWSRGAWGAASPVLAMVVVCVREKGLRFCVLTPAGAARATGVAPRRSAPRWIPQRELYAAGNSRGAQDVWAAA